MNKNSANEGYADRHSTSESKDHKVGSNRGASSNSDHSLTAVLEKIEPNDETGKVSIGDIIETLESRGFGPLLFAPAFIAIMPTGGIPGVPTICAIVISLICVQIILGKQHPWLPNFVNKIKFGKDKLQKGVDIASKVTKKIDKVSKQRLESLSSDKAKKGIALVCVLAAVAMVPLEAIPFAVIIPASSIILFAVGLITRDGYITLAALLLNLGTLYFIVSKVIGG